VSKLDQTTLLERYQSLAEISRDLASTLDLNALLDRIVHAAADLSNAEAASILLYDGNKQELYFESATNLAEPILRGLVVPVEGSIAGWIVSHRKPLIISDTQKDPRHFGNIAKLTNVTTTSMLAVPLTAKDKVVGVLEAINKRHENFNGEDQDVLMALGAQAAVAIENARLFHQSDLIAEMIHELRTPLASINTATHLLTREDVPLENRRRISDLIYTETKRLTDMTSAFLDLARLESGRVRFNPQDIDAHSLIEECVGVMREKIVESNLAMDLNLPNDLPPVRVDKDKIKQVVINLLSNAIKYNRSGGRIRIGAKVEGNTMVFSVSDTGVGIRPDDLAHLFEKFYRVRSTENIVRGTGLGLAISKRIVEVHGGQIRVESEDGVGTTFYVTLPLRAGVDKAILESD
jgi:signal transduction histidine kinase